jgi:hypothetical protein
VGADARALLAEHCDDGSGMCGGCLQGFGQLKPAPCEQARWAALVTHSDPARRAAS